MKQFLISITPLMVTSFRYRRHRSLTTLFLMLPLVLALSACLSTPATTSRSTCPPDGYSRNTIEQLKHNSFEVADDEERTAVAIALIGCVGDPDPEMRDGIVYAAYTKWLRGRLLPDDTVRAFRSALLAELKQSALDPHGFRRPFAALALAEVARTDRIAPLFTDQERDELVSAAVEYMQRINDYRGFDEVEGWRHGVAHTADLVLQLSLNEAVSTQQLQQMRSALAQQVAPDGEHFYTYGEPERLARPILFMARRGAFGEADWTRWFEKIGSPSPFESWDEVWSSQKGLAKLHNTKAFAQVVFTNASASENAKIKALLPGVLELLKRLP